jgi:hypothetical protein
MTGYPAPPEGSRGGESPRDLGSWAKGRNVLRVSDVPAGAVNMNVDGRRVAGALQGFGQLWQKTYRVRLTGADVAPEEVVKVWKREFPAFHPPESRFYPSLEGVAPGEVMLINASVQGMPVYTGVMVLYSDDVSFTVMTAEGLPEAGWNTFSAYEEDGATIVQIQSLARASDPIYELGFRLFGSTQQEKIWTHVLSTLAARFGVRGRVHLEKACVDPKLQWLRVGNLWLNAGLRSAIYTLAARGRRVRALLRRGTRSRA